MPCKWKVSGSRLLKDIFCQPSFASHLNSKRSSISFPQSLSCLCSTLDMIMPCKLKVSGSIKTCKKIFSVNCLVFRFSPKFQKVKYHSCLCSTEDMTMPCKLKVSCSRPVKYNFCQLFFCCSPKFQKVKYYIPARYFMSL